MKEKMIASNRIYLGFCYGTAIGIFVGFIMIIISDFFYDYDTFELTKFGYFLIMGGIIILIISLIMIIPGLIIESKRMKMVYEYQDAKNDPRVDEIIKIHSGIFHFAKRKRVLTCYVAEKVFPEHNPQKWSDEFKNKIDKIE